MTPGPPSPETPTNNSSEELDQKTSGSERSIGSIDDDLDNIQNKIDKAADNEEFEKAQELKKERNKLKDKKDEWLADQEEAGEINDQIDELNEEIKEAVSEEDYTKAEQLKEQREELKAGNTNALEDEGEVGQAETEVEVSEQEDTKEDPGEENINEAEQEKPVETESERQEKINEVKEELGMEVEEQPSPGSQESSQPGANAETGSAGTISGEAEPSPETVVSFDELMSDYETLQNEAELDRRESRGKMRYALSAGNLEQFREAFSQKLENDIQELERKIEILQSVRESNNGTEFYNMDEEAESRAQDHLKDDIERLKDEKESKQDQLDKLESDPEMQAKLAEQRLEVKRDQNAEIEVNRLLGDMRDMQESQSDWIEDGGAYDPKSAYELVGMANAANEHGNERGNELLREAKSVIEEAEQNANGPIDRVRT